ncbi:eCIS core domain-containing protein [Falsiroseomonas sp. CW058]|uniref:eCIS core domain-containing protein n=1 Tax=Falsiroseomonas sp. CW058 TaxID=3388664 RepID=UPI003D31696F
MDRRTTLHGAWRTRIEGALGADLGDIPIHAGPAARRIAAEAGGGWGCAVEGRVFLGDVPRAWRGQVIVHELVHAVQQRRAMAGAGAAPAPAAEAEARRATASAMAGLPAPVRLAADPRVPAAWGEAGHYYTVYFVALAVGASKKDAYRLAFWAQVPDEVNDFDAAMGGKMIVLGHISSIGTPMPVAMMPDNPIEEARLEQQTRWLRIQRGLHCLTGRGVEAELKLRLAISGRHKMPQGDALIELGLSLHAFGDVFAHRDGDKMYAAPLGHALHLHAPDRLSIFRAKLYAEYVGALYDLLAGVYWPPLRPRMTRADVVTALGGVIPPLPKVDMRCFLADDEAAALDRYMGRGAGPPLGSSAFRKACEADIRAHQAATNPSDDDERTQIGQIRDIAQQRMEAMEPYDPENKDALWLTGFKPPPDVGWYPGVEKLVSRKAREWSELE